VLSFSDGEHDLLAIAERSGVDFHLLARAAAALEDAGLAQSLDEAPPAVKLGVRA